MGERLGVGRCLGRGRDWAKKKQRNKTSGLEVLPCFFGGGFWICFFVLVLVLNKMSWSFALFFSVPQWLVRSVDLFLWVGFLTEKDEEPKKVKAFFWQGN